MEETGRSYLSDKARAAVKGMKVKTYSKKEKYSKQQLIRVYKGYDMLEDIGSIRVYIQKKYDIPLDTLELLIKLMGMKVFTREEYIELPKKLSYNRLNRLIEEGYVNRICDNRLSKFKVFTLATKGRNIVIHFYKCLVGEERVPESPYKNPLANDKKQIAYDKKKMDIIRKLNKLPVPDHKKTLFQ